MREARVLMRLKTPHVGKLLDVGNLDSSHGALPFLALEYLEGTDLDRVVHTRGRVRYREAFAWCADACDGVAEAHELGVIHRDLKPSNVFLAQSAEPTSVVKVLEFGIAGASELQMFANVMTKPPLPLRAHVKAQTPPHAQAILFQCLRRRREDRYPCMTELSAALRSAIA